MRGCALADSKRRTEDSEPGVDMDQVSTGDPGEIFLDILCHGDRRRGGGKILLLDLKNLFYVVPPQCNQDALVEKQNTLGLY